MSHKIKPNSFRTGIFKEWTARWVPRHFRFGASLQEDVVIREAINKKIGIAGIDSIVIERSAGICKITIKAAKPGLIIGRGGKGVEELNAFIMNKLRSLREKSGAKEFPSISLTIEEIKRFEVSAQVMAQQIAWDMEKRMPYRRTIKKYLERCMQNRDVKGAKIKVSGRLDGAEIARSEQVSGGSLPLQTLRANIDYGEATAFTTFGTIGIKVWIHMGSIFNNHKS
jgi:small subunit ribosomal protein S3